MKKQLMNLIYISVISIFLSSPVGAFSPEEAEKITIQNQILLYVERAYVDSISAETLLDGAIEGIMGKLDPHSSYMPKSNADDFMERIRGDFQGIGITFTIIDEKINVIDILEGGPSETAGLRSRDKIIAVDGESALGIDESGVRDKLRGSKGSKVTVTIQRPGVAEPFDVVITRGEVRIKSLTHYFMLDSTTGFISLARFSANTGDEVRSALKDLKEQGMTRLVFDLRNNTGGLLQSAVEVVRLFLSEGMIVETKGRVPHENRQWRANGKAEYENMPVIILINNATASAAEILAGALQDHDRALIVGQTSFGKGLIMKEFPIIAKRENKHNTIGSLLLSVGKYYTPSGRLIQRPYDEGREAYIRAAFEGSSTEDYRDTEESEVFFTDLGRKVYGGGGITPDRKIESARNLSRFESVVRRGYAAFQFADEFLTRNSIPTDFDAFHSEYRIPADEMTKFRSLLTAKDISMVDVIDSSAVIEDLEKFSSRYNLGGEMVGELAGTVLRSHKPEDLFEKNYDYLEKELKQEIARMVWGPTERYKIWHSRDTELADALSYLEEAQKLLLKRIASASTRNSIE